LASAAAHWRLGAFVEQGAERTITLFDLLDFSLIAHFSKSN